MWRISLRWTRDKKTFTHADINTHPSVLCWKVYVKSSCLTCVWQAWHGRWGPTAANTTNTNRRSPFCASTGGDMRWVCTCLLHCTPDLTPVGMLMHWETGWCDSRALFFLLVTRTIWCAATGTATWPSCPWCCLSSSSELPTSTISSQWCCRSDEVSPLLSHSGSSWFDCRKFDFLDSALLFTLSFLQYLKRCVKSQENLIRMCS